MRPRLLAALLAAVLLAGCGDYLEGPGAGGFHACARENVEDGMSERDAAQWCADFDAESW